MRLFRFIFVSLYLIIGVVIAWDHHYLNLAWLRTFGASCWRCSCGSLSC